MPIIDTLWSLYFNILPVLRTSFETWKKYDFKNGNKSTIALNINFAL